MRRSSKAAVHVDCPHDEPEPPNTFVSGSLRKGDQVTIDVDGVKMVGRVRDSFLAVGSNGAANFWMRLDRASQTR